MSEFTKKYHEDPSFASFTGTGGDFDTDDSHVGQEGTSWEVQYQITEDAGWVNDVLSVSGTVQHVHPPHGEGRNPNAWPFSLVIDADDVSGGSGSKSAAGTIRHGDHWDIFSAKLTASVSTTVNFDDITGYALVIKAIHSETEDGKRPTGSVPGNGRSDRVNEALERFQRASAHVSDLARREPATGQLAALREAVLESFTVAVSLALEDERTNLRTDSVERLRELEGELETFQVSTLLEWADASDTTSGASRKDKTKRVLKFAKPFLIRSKEWRSIIDELLDLINKLQRMT